MNAFFDRRDPLTGLPNRHGFGKELERAIARIARFGRRLAVLWIDLPGLDRLQEELGREASDNLRLQTAVRLAELIRRVDTIARLDRNAFGVLKTDFEGTEHVAVLARRLLTAAASEVSATPEALAPRIGIAIFPPGEAVPENLLRQARLALHHAAEHPPQEAAYAFYDKEIGREVEHRIQLLEDLRTALLGDDLTLAYQPQIDLRDGRRVGIEALVRWRHPTQGTIPPAQLLSLAASNALMPRIGQRVIELACRQLQAWRRQGLHTGSLAINLSAAELRDEQLLARVQKTLEDSQLPAAALEFEFTEAALGTGRRAVDRVIDGLHTLGVRLTLDNFGVGPSALEELTRLPLHKLKIDQSFIQRLPNDRHAVAVVRAALGLAHSLDLQVVAEGVESAQQLDFLSNEGCFAAQGFHLGFPTDPEDFAHRYLATRNEHLHDPPVG